MTICVHNIVTRTIGSSAKVSAAIVKVKIFPDSPPKSAPVSVHISFLLSKLPRPRDHVVLPAMSVSQVLARDYPTKIKDAYLQPANFVP